MTDDSFFDRLRRDAASLRYDGGAAMRTRIAARVRERIAAPPTVTQLLAQWFRPLTASLVALGLVTGMGLAYVVNNTPQPQDEVLTLSSNATEMAVAGDIVE
ncbi:MAG: hypothetical protein JOZ54_21640 [Acidobacteria bacterium]|nr:hypothetical protein [Acidobacteriota bacterium]